MENAEQKGWKKSMSALSSLALGALLCLGVGIARADTYTLPADASSAPFNCTHTSGANYACGSISLDKDSVINFTGPVTLNVAGNFTASKSLDTSGNAYAFALNVSGNASFQKDLILIGSVSAGGNISLDKDPNVVGDLAAGGNVSVDKDAVITGNISAGGNITFDKGSTITGNVDAGGNLTVNGDTVIIGNCTYSSTNYVCMPPTGTLHHVRLNHNGSGVTCTGSPVTVYACNGADSGGVCALNTNGLRGNVIANGGTGTLLASVPFVIAAGASSVTVVVPVTSPQTATLATSGLSVGASAGQTCWNGTAASCSHVYNNSGFLFDVPNHISNVPQTVSVKAVKQSDNSLACVPSFASTSKSVGFTCAYTNPSTGTLAVTVGGMALACGDNKAGTSQAVSLSFDPTGTASTTVVYADAGQIGLAATLTDNATGLTMTGSDSFIAAPKDFAFSATSTAPIKAGVNFGTTVTARNNSHIATPNFGKESTPQIPVIGFTMCQPIGGASGTFTGGLGGFDKGIANATNLNWNEVGNGDLSATLSGTPGYLGSGLGASGNTGTGGTLCNGAGNVGRFIPDHFDTSVVQPSTFTYSGQPFTNVTVTAKSAGGTTTTNFNKDGFAKDVTLTAPASPAPVAPAGEPGALSANAPSKLPLPAADFLNDATRGSLIANGTLLYTFTNKQTAPTVVKLHAEYDEGAGVIVSSGATEGSATIRSGRLRLSNAFGRANADLTIPMRAEYWSGNSWLLNSVDSLSKIPAATVALSPIDGLSGVTVKGDVTLSGGQVNMVLTKPTSGTGSVDLAVNLGSTKTDQSCLGNHPNMPAGGAALPWLRSQNGNCATGVNSDPSARGNFGIFSPQTKKVIHIRELFN